MQPPFVIHHLGPESNDTIEECLRPDFRYSTGRYHEVSYTEERAWADPSVREGEERIYCWSPECPIVDWDRLSRTSSVGWRVGTRSTEDGGTWGTSGGRRWHLQGSESGDGRCDRKRGYRRQSTGDCDFQGRDGRRYWEGDVLMAHAGIS